MATHIADLYFYEEISNALGRQCKFEWVRSPQNHKSKDKAFRISTTTCSSPSPQASKHSSPQSSAPSSPRSIQPAFNSTPIAATACSQRESRGGGGEQADNVMQHFAEIAISENPLCLKKIGLLYTDAAHSVLNDEDVAKYVRRRGSYFGHTNEF